MKENKKKIFLITIGIVVLISLVIGISYAYWKFSEKQNTNNSISTLSCLNLELTDVSDAISLTNASPITDEEAKNLKPYEFKVTNTCENNTSYVINLEVMETENRLNSNYVAAILDDGEKEILGSKTQVPKNYTGNDYTSIEAYNLGVGYIAGGEEKKHSLRIWMDESASDKSDAMSKKFISKIVITGEEMREPTLAITVNGESVDQIPEKDDYKVTVDCGSTATGVWNSDNWNLQLNSINSSNISCSIDFKVLPKLTDYVTELANTSDELAKLGSEVRYIGADPSNYVQFNNELWRIIGVMNDVADESGTIEPRIKLIRSESIGSYARDNKGTNGSTNWNNSALQEILNEGAYYNRTSGNCPSGSNNAITSCDFSNIGLIDEAKNLIDKVKWKLGGIGNPSTTTYTTDNLRYYEKGTNVYSKNPTEWTGKVGLIYPSDYSNGTGGSERTNCLKNNLVSSSNGCTVNNWLYTGSSQWTITSRNDVNSGLCVWSSEGSIAAQATRSTYDVFPVVYLNTNLKIKSGTGTSTSPFILSQ